MTISRIISGGQTGVDVAALRAAKSRGIRTGGTMPRGWRTLAGPRPEYRELFGMTEHTSASYPPRTYANVKNSDVTIRIALDFDSSGERCTHDATVAYRKPPFDILVRRHEVHGLVVDEMDIFNAAETITNIAKKNLIGEIVVKGSRTSRKVSSR